MKYDNLVRVGTIPPDATIFFLRDQTFYDLNLKRFVAINLATRIFIPMSFRSKLIQPWCYFDIPDLIAIDGQYIIGLHDPQMHTTLQLVYVTVKANDVNSVDQITY